MPIIKFLLFRPWTFVALECSILLPMNKVPTISWNLLLLHSQCCVTKFCKLNCLKQYTFIISDLLSQIFISHVWAVKSLGSFLLTKLQSRFQSGLCSLQSLSWGKIHFLALSYCWKISSPCSCRAPITVFLLAILVESYSQPLEFSHL